MKLLLQLLKRAHLLKGMCHRKRFWWRVLPMHQTLDTTSTLVIKIKCSMKRSSTVKLTYQMSILNRLKKLQSLLTILMNMLTLIRSIIWRNKINSNSSVTFPSKRAQKCTINLSQKSTSIRHSLKFLKLT